MKAFVKYGEAEGDYGIREMDIPNVGANDVLVKVKTSAICGSDLSLLSNKYKGRTPVPIPIIPGHEGAGIVAEIGEEVKSVKVGDRVGLEALVGCGQCLNCRLGNKNMCQNWEHIGLTRNGTFAEYISVSQDFVHKLPDNISFKNAACLEPIGLAARAIESIKPILGERAVIIGPGKIGLFHLQALKASGVTEVFIVGLDKDKKRFEIAEQLGATYILNGSKEDPIKRVMDITKGQGVEIVIETANSPKCFSMVPEFAGPKARIVTFGLYPEATISPLNLLRKGLTLYGDTGQLTRHFIRAIRWVEINKVLADLVITKSFSLKDAEKGIKAFKEGTEGAIIFEN